MTLPIQSVSTAKETVNHYKGCYIMPAETNPYLFLFLFLLAALVRWVVCSICLLMPYLLFGRVLFQKSTFAKRTYRYAYWNE